MNKLVQSGAEDYGAFYPHNIATEDEVRSALGLMAETKQTSDAAPATTKHAAAVETVVGTEVTAATEQAARGAGRGSLQPYVYDAVTLPLIDRAVWLTFLATRDAIPQLPGSGGSTKTASSIPASGANCGGSGDGGSSASGKDSSGGIDIGDYGNSSCNSNGSSRGGPDDSVGGGSGSGGAAVGAAKAEAGPVEEDPAAMHRVELIAGRDRDGDDDVDDSGNEDDEEAGGLFVWAGLDFIISADGRPHMLEANVKPRCVRRARPPPQLALHDHVTFSPVMH